MAYFDISGQRCAPSTPTRRQMGVLARIGRIAALYRQRRTLAALPPAALRDIGITRAEAEAEARRPVWDAPAHWSR